MRVYPEITLAEAREKHRVAHKIVSQGQDPIQLKREATPNIEQEQGNTFVFNQLLIFLMWSPFFLNMIVVIVTF